jgi:hypothetical protein
MGVVQRLLPFLVLASCSGELIGGVVLGPDGLPVTPGARPPTQGEPAPLPLDSGARRLSRRELLAAVTRLTGVDVVTELPGFDVRTLPRARRRRSSSTPASAGRRRHSTRW